MKMNRPPRTWSAANAAAAGRPKTEPIGGDESAPTQVDALHDALGAYLQTAPSAESEVASSTASKLVAMITAHESKEPAMAVNPIQYLPEPDVDAAPSANESDAYAAHAEPVAQDAQPTMSVDALISRLNRTRRSIADALAYCGDAADEISAAASTFAAAATQMRAVAAEQVELESMISIAVSDLVALSDSIAHRESQAVEAASALLEQTNREAEELRAIAVADVERARHRLLQFTTEIGNVASELQGGLAERQAGQRVA